MVFVKKRPPLHTDSSGSTMMDSQTSVSSKTVLPLHKTRFHRDVSDGSRSSSGSPTNYRRTSSRYSITSDDLSESVTLPTWSANPQSPGDDRSPSPQGSTGSGSDHHHHRYQSYGSHYYNNHRHYLHLMFKYLPMIVGGLFFCMGMGTILQSRGSLLYSLEEVTQLVHNSHVLQHKLNDAEKGIKLLQREVSAYDVMLQQQQQQQKKKTTSVDDSLALLQHQEPQNRALQEMQQLSDRLEESQQRANTLKERVQRLSQEEAVAKYGHGVHKVLLELIFPDGREGPTQFVIELAPLELMPHSVHFFLEMVSSGLLDGCSFILNALHVLKAAPLPYDGSSAANKAREFSRRGLESVAFKEYASSYPHEQYTVGFAADGSPSFYINTQDNSEIHWGDPCFGRIVEGFDTVKRLEASPTRNGIWFEQRIGIHKATVLS